MRTDAPGGASLIDQEPSRLQSGTGDDETGGYVGHVETAITETSPETRLVNVADTTPVTVPGLD